MTPRLKQIVALVVAMFAATVATLAILLEWSNPRWTAGLPAAVALIAYALLLERG